MGLPIQGAGGAQFQRHLGALGKIVIQSGFIRYQGERHHQSRLPTRKIREARLPLGTLSLYTCNRCPGILDGRPQV